MVYTELFWMHLMTHLRMASLAMIILGIGVVLFNETPSRYRNLRLLLGFILVAVNSAAILVSVLVFKTYPL